MSAAALTLLLCSCSRPTPAPETQPQWDGARVDGIAPLMSPQTVSLALQSRGYRQVACVPERPVRPDMLERGDDPGCFEASGRPMRVRLTFFDLREGRRLAIVNFNERDLYNKSKAMRIKSGQALARRLRSQLGKPLTSARNPSFATLYWRRSGGSPSLPDLISTTVGADFGANVAMTSFWAYGQRKEQK